MFQLQLISVFWNSVAQPNIVSGICNGVLT